MFDRHPRRVSCTPFPGCSQIVQELFFFSKDEIEEHVRCQMSKLSRLKTCVPKLIHHLMGGGDITVHTTCEPQIKQWSCKSSRCCERQNSTPAQAPRLLHSLPQDVRLTSGPPTSPARLPKQPSELSRVGSQNQGRFFLSFSGCEYTAPSTFAAWEWAGPSQ